MVPLVAKVPHVVSQPTFAWEGWLTMTAAGADGTLNLQLFSLNSVSMSFDLSPERGGLNIA